MSGEDRNKLTKELEIAAWEHLLPHFHRGALFVVDNNIDIVDAGMAIASDQVDLIKTWLSEGQFRPPSEPEILSWESDKKAKFWYLIVQPYVVIKPAPPN